MFQRFATKKAVAATLLAGLIAGPALVTPAAAIDEADRPAIEQIVRDYLLANPEILIEMQTAFEAKQEAQRKEQQLATLEAERETIFNSDYQMVIGNPEAKITVVEFFDYNCGFCQRAMGDMQRILSERDDIKFVLKEFPVLGENSQQAHLVSVAFFKLMPEKYEEFHSALLGLRGTKTAEAAIEVAVELGADEQALRAQMDDQENIRFFQESYQLADGLGITGTPSYVIGDQVVFGAVGYDRLMDAIGQLDTQTTQ